MSRTRSVHIYAHPRDTRGSRTIGTTGVSDGLPSWTALEQWDFDVFAYSSDMLLPICARVLLRFASFGHFRIFITFLQIIRKPRHLSSKVLRLFFWSLFSIIRISRENTGCRIPNNTEKTIGFFPDRSPRHNNICHPPSYHALGCLPTCMPRMFSNEPLAGLTSPSDSISQRPCWPTFYVPCVMDTWTIHITIGSPSWSLFFSSESFYFLNTVVRLLMNKKRMNNFFVRLFLSC